MVALALACTHRDAVTHLAILDAPMPGWSQWEALFADPKVWHFAFHMKRDLPERLLFGREYDYVSTFIFDRAFDHRAHTIEDLEESGTKWTRSSTNYCTVRSLFNILVVGVCAGPPTVASSSSHR